MSQHFPSNLYPQVRYFLGDIRDKDRLSLALERIDTVVHAAALSKYLQPSTIQLNSSRLTLLVLKILSSVVLVAMSEK